MIQQQNAGIRLAPDDVAEKPYELKKYEQMKETGLPLVAGGVQDQPHIWLAMLGTIRNTLKIFAATNRTPEQQSEENSNANTISLL